MADSLLDHPDMQEAIRRIVAQAPPLTAEQRGRIAAMLRPWVAAQGGELGPGGVNG